MKQHTKLDHKQEHQVEQQSQQESAQEFKGSDELLRFDASQVQVPPEIAQKLQKSSAQLSPSASRPWWKHLFGG